MKRFAGIILFLSLFFLSACAAANTPLDNYLPGEQDRLVIYTSHKQQVYEPIIREFEERTGIWVEVVNGGTYEMLDRIASEQDNPKADIMFGGGADSLDAYRVNFEPYASIEAELVAAPLQDPDHYWTPFSALPVVFIYNSSLVEQSALTCWQDLFRPEFHGRIAFADPSKSGSCFTALCTAWYVGGISCLNELAQSLDGNLLASSGTILTDVAAGTSLVGITLEETALHAIHNDSSLTIVYPSDGTSCVPDGTAIVRGARHPENAKRFVDFTLSYDVQDFLVRELFRRSVRTDIGSLQSLPPLNDLLLVTYDSQWISENRKSLLTHWASCFGEG